MRIKSLLISILTCVICLSSCSNHHDKDHKHNHDEKKHNHTESEIILPTSEAKRFGVTTQIIKPQSFNSVIKVSGQIINTPTDISTISATTPGIISFPKGIINGEKVNKGQTIALIKSSTITGGNPNTAARVTMEAARKEVERLTPLLADGIVTRREYNAAVAAYESARAAYSPTASSGRISTPIDGVIIQLLVNPGEFVEVGTPIATVSKNAALTLQADLPEKYRMISSQIIGANIRTTYNNIWINIDSLDGHRINTPTDMSTTVAGYIPIYFTLQNNGSLSAGSFVDICLLSNSTDNVIAIPTQAIIELQGSYFAYIKVSDHGYIKKKIIPGTSNGLLTSIKNGLNAGDEVVVDGAITIRLAESSGSIPSGHNHNH